MNYVYTMKRNSDLAGAMMYDDLPCAIAQSEDCVQLRRSPETRQREISILYVNCLNAKDTPPYLGGLPTGTYAYKLCSALLPGDKVIVLV